MKSFIIYLSKFEKSVNSANRLKSELESFDIFPELFEGSYGDVTLKKYKEEGRQCHPWTFKGPDILLDDEYKESLTKPGLIGCFDSHYRLWEKCVELNEPIIIFEDDAQVIRPFQLVEWKEVLSLVFSHGKKMQKYSDLLLSPTGNPKALGYAQSSMPGNAGYAIKPAAAKKLVDTYKNSFLPADNAINQHIVTIEIYSHMLGKAIARDPNDKKSSFIRTKIWDNK
jgi:GR25 family glycosyltransferase involved in LPS biosynthesis